MKHARFFLLLITGLTLTLPLRASAQNSPYTSPKGNVGSWSWDKSQPKPVEEEDEDEDEEEQESGETSWERMQSERQPAEAAPPQGEILESFSPLGLWRWWRGEKKTEKTETREATATPDSDEANAEASAESEEE